MKSDTGYPANRSRSRVHPNIVFVYPARDSLWPGLGRDLWNREPVFRRTMDRCDAVIERQLGWSITKELLREGNSFRLLSRDEYMEPFLTSVQISLTEVWKAAGVFPHAVFGRCVGEFAAGYAAGLIDLEYALTLSCRISQLFRKRLGLGKVMKIKSAGKECQSICAAAPRALHWAAQIHADKALVVCADEDRASIIRYFDEQEIMWRDLELEFGLHSPLMDSWREDFLRPLETQQPGTPPSPAYSATTGGRVPPDSVELSHWWRVIREPLVGEAAAIRSMLDHGYETFLEVSGNPSLGDIIRFVAREVGKPVRVLSTLPEGEQGGLPLKRWQQMTVGGGGWASNSDDRSAEPRPIPRKRFT